MKVHSRIITLLDYKKQTKNMLMDMKIEYQLLKIQEKTTKQQRKDYFLPT